MYNIPTVLGGLLVLIHFFTSFVALTASRAAVLARSGRRQPPPVELF